MVKYVVVVKDRMQSVSQVIGPFDDYELALDYCVKRGEYNDYDFFYVMELEKTVLARMNK